MATGTLVRVKAVLANSEIAQFGLRFETPGYPLSYDDLTDLADAAQTALLAHDDLFAPDIELGQCSAQSFHHATDGSGHGYWQPTSAEAPTAVPTGPGTAAGESSSPQCALAVTLRTGAAGRRNLGRVFTFPPPEGVVAADGTVSDSGARADMVSDIIDAVGAVAVAGGAVIPAVFSAKFDSSEPILTVVANGRIDTQRRRLQR